MFSLGDGLISFLEWPSLSAEKKIRNLISLEDGVIRSPALKALFEQLMSY
jgi:hypothetical protein